MNAKYLTIMCLLVINCRIAKTNDPTEENTKRLIEIEELWKNVELKEWVQSEEICRGYTYVFNLVNVLPNHINEIIEWIEKNRENDDVEQGKLEKSRFDSLMQSLTLKFEELKEINKCLEENQKNKLIEIKKLWKNLKQKEWVQSKEKWLGITTSTVLIKKLPNYEEHISNWIKENPAIYENEPLQLAKPRFMGLLQHLTLKLEELQEIN